MSRAVVDPSLRTTFTIEAMSFTFIVPRKAILTKDQLEHFQNSKTHEEILAYIQTLNDAVVGVKLTDSCTTSPVRKSFEGTRMLTS